MIKLKTLAFGVALTAMSVSAFADNHGGMVDGYVESKAGVVVNSYGECWRSRFENTEEKKIECGYAEPVIMEKEVVIAPTAATVTTIVAQDVTISAALLFGFDKDQLSDDAKAVIDERVERFKDSGELTRDVSVIGHTDSTGPEAYNQKLSERRAASVAAYLEQHTRITDDKIDAVGMGESDPAADNSTKEGRAANRRVIIHLEGTMPKQ
jgi:outer membrane protein OmpA-like peptidoglycan-associated protein